ncbi:MAG: magnesium/cobalt transporter CorA [Flavobacteriaceae bacterium]|nr:magnesium/cobalt transporter CorA [Flavobacteriaceae bacterium]
MNKSKHPKTKKRTRRSSKNLGRAPGEVIYIGDKESKITKLEVFDYKNDHIDTLYTDTIEDVFQFKGNNQVTWINVDGLGNTDEIIKLGEYFKLHPLILEDIVDTKQRPKIDEYEHYLFIVLKMLYFNKNKEFVTEHVSIVLGKDYVLTFQESEDDIFDTVRNRLTNENSRVRNSSADYLAFALMDAIIDNYFTVMDDISDRIEVLEDQLFMENHDDSITKDIQLLKHDILRIRRNIFPSREVVGRIVKSATDLINEKTQDYFRDLQDHSLHINENIDVYREMIWGLMDMYMTTISNKMNNIMKVLTIIATIFIPLTFIVGVYGMNFEFMPELSYKYGYFVVWAFMLIVFISLLIYFRIKKWL